MHRIRLSIALTGLVWASTTLLTSQATAGLIRPGAGRSFPDILANNISGGVRYTFDSSTQTGTFTLTNTPYLIAGGPEASKEYTVDPNADGVRRQVLTVALDANGNIKADDPANNYELWGSVTAGGQTFNGLLLKGTPTLFGSQDLDPVGIPNSDVFDAVLKITDGALKPYFAPSDIYSNVEPYIRITPELESTFVGAFDRDFSGVKATSNTRTYFLLSSIPVPEPTTALVLLAGGVGLIHRHRRTQKCRVLGAVSL
jgi:hypothetical protein